MRPVAAIVAALVLLPDLPQVQTNDTPHTEHFDTVERPIVAGRVYQKSETPRLRR